MSSANGTSGFNLSSDKLAKLRTISLHELQSGSAEEQKLLLQTCMEDGFFYLDLNHTTLAPLLANVENTFDVAKELFDYPEDFKMLFDVDKLSDMKLNGYKPKGRNVVAGGKRDGFETWQIPRDGLLQFSNEPFAHPPAIANNLRGLRGTVQGLDFAANTILSALSDTLRISNGQHLENFQGLTRPAPDILRVLKYHATAAATDVAPHIPHTDIGSLTFVFSSSWGLQVLPTTIEQKAGNYSESDWLFVEPKPGHAVVNIGDCISMMTNGVLKSALHRVGPPHGTAMPERYSLAYLMRPEDETVLRTLDSPLIPRSISTGQDAMTSGAWIKKKFVSLRSKNGIVDNHDQILTGGRGVLV